MFADNPEKSNCRYWILKTSFRHHNWICSRMLTKLNKGRRGGGGTGLGRGVGTVGYITLLSRAKVPTEGLGHLCVCATRDVLRIVSMSHASILIFTMSLAGRCFSTSLLNSNVPLIQMYPFMHFLCSLDQDFWKDI